MAAARPIVHATSSPGDPVAECGCGVPSRRRIPTRLRRDRADRLDSCRGALRARHARPPPGRGAPRLSDPRGASARCGRAVGRLPARRWESDLRGGRLRLRACFAPVLVGLLAAACGLGVASLPAAGKERVVRPACGRRSLANTRIGGPYGTTLAFRFRPTWSGSVTGVRFYVVVNSGGEGEYSGGDGGILRVAVTAPTLASRRQMRSPVRSFIRRPARSASPSPASTSRRRSSRGATTTSSSRTRARSARELVSVHALVGSAAGPSPPPLAAVCCWATRPTAARPTRRARAQESGDATSDPRCRGRPGRAARRPRLHGVWISNPKPIGGSAACASCSPTGPGVRACSGRWYVCGARRPRRAAEREARGSGREDAGHLECPCYGVPSGGLGWVSTTFRHPPVLRPGQRLAFVLRSSGGAFEAFPLREGIAFGFTGDTVFGSGYAQFSSSGNWTGWDQWGDSTATTATCSSPCGWTVSVLSCAASAPAAAPRHAGEQGRAARW